MFYHVACVRDKDNFVILSTTSPLKDVNTLKNKCKYHDAYDRRQTYIYIPKFFFLIDLLLFIL